MGSGSISLPLSLQVTTAAPPDPPPGEGEGSKNGAKSLYTGAKLQAAGTHPGGPIQLGPLDSESHTGHVDAPNPAGPTRGHHFLFRLSSGLQLEATMSTGPVLDNRDCLLPVMPDECTHAQLTNLN